MTIERWQAHGNAYLVSDEPGFTPERVRGEVGDADGIVEVIARGEDWADIVIWNADGSTAEMSGNATRIAAAWVGADSVCIRVGGLEVEGLFELGDAFALRGRVFVEGLAQVAMLPETGSAVGGRLGGEEQRGQGQGEAQGHSPSV